MNKNKVILNSICDYFLGTLTVEEVYKDRDQFASLVREVAAPDVGRMGIEILSFTIKDVYDNVTYLASLGNFITNNRNAN
jgi:flotillin